MKKTLIVVDMQADFVDGALGTPEAVAIVPNVKAKIEQYLAAQDAVVFTRDTHYDDYLTTNEGKHLPVEHCIKGTPGWEIVDALQEDIDGMVVVDKPTFGWKLWESTMAQNNLPTEEIELVGLCTDICVVSNALILKALYPEARITVDASCCAGVTPESHSAALATMKMCQIEVTGE